MRKQSRRPFEGPSRSGPDSIHCFLRLNLSDFKEETLKVIKNIIGHVKVTEFTPAHEAFFEKERRKSVAGVTRRADTGPRHQVTSGLDHTGKWVERSVPIHL